jgi:hypothetical protein
LLKAILEPFNPNKIIGLKEAVKSILTQEVLGDTAQQYISKMDNLLNNQKEAILQHFKLDCMNEQEEQQNRITETVKRTSREIKNKVKKQMETDLETKANEMMNKKTDEIRKQVEAIVNSGNTSIERIKQKLMDRCVGKVKEMTAAIINMEKSKMERQQEYTEAVTTTTVTLLKKTTDHIKQLCKETKKEMRTTYKESKNQLENFATSTYDNFAMKLPDEVPTELKDAVEKIKAIRVMVERINRYQSKLDTALKTMEKFATLQQQVENTASNLSGAVINAQETLADLTKMVSTAQTDVAEIQTLKKEYEAVANINVKLDAMATNFALKEREYLKDYEKSHKERQEYATQVEADFRGLRLQMAGMHKEYEKEMEEMQKTHREEITNLMEQHQKDIKHVSNTDLTRMEELE